MEPRKMMGIVTPQDQVVGIRVRDWHAMKLALWRSRNGWEIAARSAEELLSTCRHTDGCPGAELETEPCLRDEYTENVLTRQGCPDREIRMSALVILNSARAFAPLEARVPNEPYMAPSREYYSDIVGELVLTQAALEASNEELRKLGKEPPQPSPNSLLALPKRKPSPIPQLDTSSEESST